MGLYNHIRIHIELLSMTHNLEQGHIRNILILHLYNRHNNQFYTDCYFLDQTQIQNKMQVDVRIQIQKPQACHSNFARTDHPSFLHESETYKNGTRFHVC